MTCKACSKKVQVPGRVCEKKLSNLSQGLVLDLMVKLHHDKLCLVAETSDLVLNLNT